MRSTLQLIRLLVGATPHKGTAVSTRHGDACCDGVPLSDLLLDLVLKVRKGGAHQGMTLEHLLKSRMLGEAREVMPVERLQEAIDHGFVVVSGHERLLGETDYTASSDRTPPSLHPIRRAKAGSALILTPAFTNARRRIYCEPLAAAEHQSGTEKAGLRKLVPWT
jgi:hypothetical protein